MPDMNAVLIADYDVRITKLEKSLAKATALTSKTFDGVERRAKQSSQRLEAEMAKTGTAIERINKSLGNIGAGAFIGIGQGALLAVAPMLTLGAAINGTKAALDKFGEINDRSTRAGLDPEFFQGIAYQAKLAGVEIDGISTAAENFRKVSAEAIEGRGKLVAQLSAEHAPLLRSIELAGTQEQRWRLIADAIRDAKGADDALVIATAAFGTQGAKLVDVFKDGGAEIDRTIDRAKSLGIVVDRDVIAHADELGDKFDTVADIIDNQLKTALVNLGPVIVGLTGYVAEWTKDLNIVLDQLKSIEDRTFINPLQNRLVELENRMATIKPILDGLNGSTGGIQGVQLQREYNDALAEALRLQERIAQLQGKPKDNLTAPPSSVPLSPVLKPERSVGSNARETARHDPGDLRDGASVEAVATSLGHVAKAAHDSTVALGTTDKAVDDLHRQLEQFEGLAEGFVGDLISGFEAGHSAVETLADAFGNLGDQLLRFAANAAIKSIFASLMGGPIVAGAGIAGGVLGFAGGGYTGPGGRNDVAGVVHRGEVVWSQADVARYGGPAVVDAMRRLPGFADGGVVGSVPAVAGGTSFGGTTIAPTINVTVEGGSRGPEADKAMGQGIAKQIEAQLRGLISSEIQNSMRPGNPLSYLGRR